MDVLIVGAGGWTGLPNGREPVVDRTGRSGRVQTASRRARDRPGRIGWMDDRRTEMVDGPTGPLEVYVLGEGPAVLMIPSLGRGAADFDRLAADVATAGYRTLVPEPRGIGRSNDVLTGVSMGDLADDVAAVIDACTGRSATVIGHTFGNRVRG